jgi:hypothetical protein
MTANTNRFKYSFENNRTALGTSAEPALGFRRPDSIRKDLPSLPVQAIQPDKLQENPRNVFAQPHFRTKSNIARLSFKDFKKASGNSPSNIAKQTLPLKPFAIDVLARSPVTKNQALDQSPSQFQHKILRSKIEPLSQRKDDTRTETDPHNYNKCQSTPTQNVHSQDVPDTYRLSASESKEFRMTEQDEPFSPGNHPTKRSYKLPELFNNPGTSPQVCQTAQKLFSSTTAQQQQADVTTDDSNFNTPHSTENSNTIIPMDSPKDFSMKLTDSTNTETPKLEKINNKIRTNDNANALNVIVGAVCKWKDEVTEKDAKIVKLVRASYIINGLSV